MTHIPRWMKIVLIAAGAYNLLWGGFVLAFPEALFVWSGMQPPLYPQIWQCVGMIVGVYGVGYLIAATNPLRHWPIVLVGLMGKVLGPIGFVQAVMDGTFAITMGWTILTNDLIWWVPFTLILVRACQNRTGNEPATVRPSTSVGTGVQS